MSHRSLVFSVVALLALLWPAPACGEQRPSPASGTTGTATSLTTTPTASVVTPVAVATASATASPAPSAPPASVTATPRPPATPPPATTATSTPRPAATPTPTPAPSPVAHIIMVGGVPARLAPGIQADLSGGRSLALVEVTGDSRCPLDAQCIWAGEATLVFEWASPGAAIQRVRVVAAPSSGSAELAGGLRLRLLELRPAPATTRAIAPSEYLATVVVEPAAAPTAGVFGTVSVGPMCPVQREGVPCPDRPLAATLAFRDAAGVEVARTLSDVAGFYAVGLRPGRYTVVPLTPGAAVLPRGVPREIDVPAGGWIAADISYDSGIR